MVRFFDKFNTPWAVGIALVFFLFVDGFLFYRYPQHNAIPIITEVEAVAAEESIGPLKPGLSTSEEPAALVEEQEPATEEELAVPNEAAAPPPG